MKHCIVFVVLRNANLTHCPQMLESSAGEGGRGILMVFVQHRFLEHRVPWILVFALLVFPLQAQQSQQAATLQGIVRDPEGKGTSGAFVELRLKDAPEVRTVLTDAQGKYKFTALAGGVYTLRVIRNGFDDAQIDSVFLASNETKSLDLKLGAPSTMASENAPQFFDPPQFTVSGVTDTTSLGGHGSDTVIRTRNSLAKETASLGEPATGGQGNTALAEKTLREKIERDPQSVEDNHRLGELLLDSGRAREALPYLERAAVAGTSSYQNAYDLARANTATGNYERAREELLRLTKSHQKAEWHHLLGDVEEKLGNSLEAVRQYQRAAELEPTEPYLFDWGTELLLHHAPEPAQEVFAKGNRLFPRSSRMLIGLGVAWFAQGSYDLAIQRVCEASDLSPSDPAPYLFLGRMEQAVSKAPDALVERLQRFVASHPESADAHYYYAVGLWKLRTGSHDTDRTSSVQSLLQNAIRLDTKHSAAVLQLGIVQAEEGKYREAISNYQRAIQINSQFEEAHYRLAQAYRMTGQADKAKEELRIYEQLARESAQNADRERHEIRQFVYTLKDQPSPEIK